MKKKQTSIIIESFAGSLLILILLLARNPVYAGTPSEPHDADAMWVEPASITFTPENATIGQKFNITVWLNITSDDVFSWSIGLYYNRTQLRAVRGGHTAPPTSQFMEGHSTSAPPLVIDTSYLGNGSVLATETCLGDDNITTPRVGSLIWIEFEVLMVPPEGQVYTSKFDISTEYPGETWVREPSMLEIIPTTPYDGDYTIIPEFFPLSLMLILLILTLIVATFKRKKTADSK